MDIRRGVIRAFDAQAYLADVQIVGSLATTLSGVPVAKHIGTDLLTPGTKCGLLFFDETNPADACVFFVYDGAPTPWVTSALIKDGEVAVGDLAFDPATQAELEAHAASPNAHHIVDSGVVTTPTISTLGWKTQAVSFNVSFGAVPNVVFVPDNSGTGDIVVDEFRVRKGTLSTTGFTIDYKVIGIASNGTFKFQWIAVLP